MFNNTQEYNSYKRYKKYKNKYKKLRAGARSPTMKKIPDTLTELDKIKDADTECRYIEGVSCNKICDNLPYLRKHGYDITSTKYEGNPILEADMCNRYVNAQVDSVYKKGEWGGPGENKTGYNKYLQVGNTNLRPGEIGCTSYTDEWITQLKYLPSAERYGHIKKCRDGYRIFTTATNDIVRKIDTENRIANKLRELHITRVQYDYILKIINELNLSIDIDKYVIEAEKENLSIDVYNGVMNKLSTNGYDIEKHSNSAMMNKMSIEYYLNIIEAAQAAFKKQRDLSELCNALRLETEPSLFTLYTTLEYRFEDFMSAYITVTRIKGMDTTRSFQDIKIYSGDDKYVKDGFAIGDITLADEFEERLVYYISNIFKMNMSKK